MKTSIPFHPVPQLYAASTALSDFEAILSSVTEGFFLLDTGFRIILKNQHGAEFIEKASGIHPQKGDNILDVIPVQMKEPARLVLEDVLRGNPQEYDIPVKVKSGISHYTISYTPILAANSVTGICIVAKDITEKKNAEYLLKKSERRWQFALEGSGSGVWEYNFLTDESYYSPGYKKILGFTEDEFPNDSNAWRSRIHVDDLAIVQQIDSDYATGIIDRHDVQYRIKNKSGAYIWVHDKGMLVEKTHGGQPALLIGTQADINAKKTYEENLKKLNDRFSSFMENTPTLTWIIDDQHRFRYINKPYMKTFNLDESAIGKSIYEIFPPEVCDVYRTNNYRVWDTGLAIEAIEEAITPSGSRLILQTFKFPLVAEGPVRLLGGTALDITQLHSATEELQLGNERYYYADRATSDAIWDWNITSNRIVWGEAYKTLFGHHTEKMSFEFYGQYLHPDDKQEVLNSLEETLAGTKEQWTKEYRFRCGNGIYKYVLDKGYIIRNSEGVATRMIGAMRDITEQRFLEKTLAEDKEQRQKEVMKAVMDAQENERSEISYELHESINQILASSKLMLGLELKDKKKNAHLLKASENIQKAMDEIRTISYRLNPSIIQLAGLEGALTDLAGKTKAEHKLNVGFKQHTKKTHIPYPLQIAIFRIVQAQLDNIIEHADATKAEITLITRENDLLLSIVDNGKGFNEKESPQKLGLKNIFNRVHFHNGKVSIKTAPGDGCLLEAQFPLDK